jgi:hypothetical protein
LSRPEGRRAMTFANPYLYLFGAVYAFVIGFVMFGT